MNRSHGNVGVNILSTTCHLLQFAGWPSWVFAGAVGPDDVVEAVVGAEVVDEGTALVPGREGSMPGARTQYLYPATC